MNAGGSVLIGVGNAYRRDDGVGPLVAAAVAARDVPDLRIEYCTAEPTAVLDAWDGAARAVIVDAVTGDSPGRVHRLAITDLAELATVSSHDLNLAQAYALASELGRAPGSVVVVGIEVGDTRHGVGLSPQVEAAVPEAVRAVLDVLGQACEKGAHQSP